MLESIICNGCKLPVKKLPCAFCMVEIRRSIDHARTILTEPSTPLEGQLMGACISIKYAGYKLNLIATDPGRSQDATDLMEDAEYVGWNVNDTELAFGPNHERIDRHRPAVERLITLAEGMVQ